MSMNRILYRFQIAYLPPPLLDTSSLNTLSFGLHVALDEHRTHFLSSAHLHQNLENFPPWHSTFRWYEDPFPKYSMSHMAFSDSSQTEICGLYPLLQQKIEPSGSYADIYDSTFFDAPRLALAFRAGMLRD